ncbi:MAG: rRNA adenine N-6-methyltransferase family protein [Mariprofundales bacterium]
MTTIDYTAARATMVENQIRACKVLDPNLLEFLLQMPREQFVPQAVRSIAYMEGHVPLPNGQEMLSPLQEAYILRQLALTGKERVLLVGAGSGYLTAMLSMQAESVVACELHAPLVQLATDNLRDHGADNTTVMAINGMDADACATINGSFDVLVVATAVATIPDHLANMVEDGGQIIAFVGSNPVVEMIHQQRLGDGVVRTTVVMETLLQDVEGEITRREFVF